MIHSAAGRYAPVFPFLSERLCIQLTLSIRNCAKFAKQIEIIYRIIHKVLLTKLLTKAILTQLRENELTAQQRTLRALEIQIQFKERNTGHVVVNFEYG